MSKFSTNINCGSCVKAVTAILDTEFGSGNWSVDTDNDLKVLSVSRELELTEMKSILDDAGFEAYEKL